MTHRRLPLACVQELLTSLVGEDVAGQWEFEPVATVARQSDVSPDLGDKLGVRHMS